MKSNGSTPCRYFLRSMAVWLLTAGSAFADQIVIDFDRVPGHGLVVKQVDLTPALKVSKFNLTDLHSLVAADAEGKPVPLQFIPDADFDPVRKATGVLVVRLTPNRPHQLTLVSGPKSERTVQPESVVTPSYTVLHDAGRGGLPTKILFRSTGKVFDNFRWQDRLHHKELGGFTLHNDKNASVEYLAAGPLCTAVRVRARYTNGEGKSPASNPEARYDWIYLHDLPLVWVTAEIRQTTPFEWNELHFLELNFPGEDFQNWAGGDPLSQGRFEATGKSLPAAKWGALLDGTNAIAMFDCGRLIFHDGRGGYGTYLHADVDRAWSTWSQTQARFSAWLWIGSAESPIKEIQTIVAQPPTTAYIVATTAGVRKALQSTGNPQADKWLNAMAAKLEAAGRLTEAVDIAQDRLLPNWTRVEAGAMNLILEKAPQGIRVLSLFDATAGRELLATTPPALFFLDLRNSKTKEHSILAADTGWNRMEISEADASGRRIVILQDPTDSRLKGIHVELALTPDNPASALDWNLRVTNSNDQWGLWRVTFPQVSVNDLGKGSRVFLPHTAGIEVSDMWTTAGRKGGTYPSGWTCMQYMATYDAAGQTGLYVGMHDPFGSTKDIFAEGLPDQRAVAFRFEHPVPDMGRPGVSFELPGQARWQILRGDWFDAATLYRNWASREAKWWPKLGLDGRSDTPEWMRQLPAWVMTGGSAAECVAQVKRFRQEVGVPVGFHWYNWHQIPFDNDYPHYFPPKNGFAEGVAELKAAGVFAMPYINGRLWDIHDQGAKDSQFTALALPAATKDESGKPYIESYGSKESDGSNVQLAPMCPSTPLWQGRVREIVMRLLTEYGLNGVYIDQVAAAQPCLCFDASHGHPLGGGHWWTQGYWTMLDAIRATKPAEYMLTTECNGEPYIRWFDGYLTWHWQEQNMVPAFSAVYGGTIQMFGRAYRGGPTEDLANRMKAGQQLVFGEQIGWFGPEILQRPESGKFLGDCIQMRWRLKEYFSAGHMVRPPKLTGTIPTVTADWQWQNEWPVTTPAVLTGAWQHQNGKVILLFVNVSDRGLASPVQFNPKDYHLSGTLFKVTGISAAGSQSEFSVQAGEQSKVDLPPHGILVWEVSS